MPEMRFDVRWPDGERRSYYSPSLVVEEYLQAGAEYPVPDFVQRTRAALTIAGERVEAKFGFPCSRAAASISAIERTAADADGTVYVEAFHR